MSGYHSETGFPNRTEAIGLLLTMLVTAVVAAIVNLSVVAIAPVFVDLPSDIAALQFGPIVGASVLPAVVATILYALLRRYTAAAERILLAVSTAVLALSFVGYSNFEPGTAGTPGAIPADPQLIINTLILLSVMHVLTAAIIVAGVVWLTERRIEK